MFFTNTKLLYEESKAICRGRGGEGSPDEGPLLNHPVIVQRRGYVFALGIIPQASVPSGSSICFRTRFHIVGYAITGHRGIDR